VETIFDTANAKAALYTIKTLFEMKHRPVYEGKGEGGLTPPGDHL
jgi:hypothetical protein